MLFRVCFGFCLRVSKGLHVTRISHYKTSAVATLNRQALNADVPEGWVTGEGGGEYEGLVYYYCLLYTSPSPRD